MEPPSLLVPVPFLMSNSLRYTTTCLGPLLHRYLRGFKKSTDKVASTLLRGHCKERSDLLMDMFAATFRTFDLVFLVFGQGQNYLKRFLAIFTVKLIARH